MRPIKFRGKAQDGKYYCGDLIHIDNVPNIRMCEGSNTYYIDVYPETVAQLVGYDADGAEVYEGDTVRHFTGELVKVRLSGETDTYSYLGVAGEKFDDCRLEKE